MLIFSDINYLCPLHKLLELSVYKDIKISYIQIYYLDYIWNY